MPWPMTALPSTHTTSLCRVHITALANYATTHTTSLCRVHITALSNYGTTHTTSLYRVHITALANDDTTYTTSLCRVHITDLANDGTTYTTSPCRVHSTASANDSTTYITSLCRVHITALSNDGSTCNLMPLLPRQYTIACLVQHACAASTSTLFHPKQYVLLLLTTALYNTLICLIPLKETPCIWGISVASYERNLKQEPRYLGYFRCFV